LHWKNVYCSIKHVRKALFLRYSDDFKARLYIQKVLNNIKIIFKEVLQPMVSLVERNCRNSKYVMVGNGGIMVG